jgi:diaphanous 1
VGAKLDTVILACYEVRGSEKFTLLLKMILDVGNMMNRGTHKGAATGFKLDVLTRLCDTRASTAAGAKEPRTLLDYIVKLVDSRNPSLFAFADEMASVSSAAVISVKQLVSEVSGVQVGFSQFTKLLEEEEAGANTAFVAEVRGFVASGKEKLAALQARMSVMIEIFRDVAAFFGEDPKKCSPEEFFGIITAFILSVTSARGRLC